MDKEELKMRRRQQMMFKINEKYIKDLKLRNLHEFYLENLLVGGNPLEEMAD